MDRDLCDRRENRSGRKTRLLNRRYYPHQPTEKNGTRTEGQGEDRGIQPVEIRLPSEHEPRDTYPAERYRRVLEPARPNKPLRGDKRILRDHRDEQRASPSTRERYPGPIEDRGRANGFHLFRVQRIHAIPELIPDLPKPGERRCHSLLRDTRTGLCYLFREESLDPSDHQLPHKRL